MEPVSTISGAWTIAKTAGEISKQLFEFGKNLRDREQRQRLDEILDVVRELKQSAGELEDENRGLREKLRFKSEDYEFRTPFYYENRSQSNRCAQNASREKSTLRWANLDRIAFRNIDGALYVAK